jgi:hypothetical protein
MNINFFTVLFCGFIFLGAKGGCKHSGVSELNPVPAAELRTAGFLESRLRKDYTGSMNTMEARLTLSVETDGQALQFNGQLIWLRDSIIWLNVKKFGFEAMRAMVTTDSVWVLNRLTKQYSASGIEGLQRKYNLPAGFELLQAALLAQPWIPEDLNFQSDIHEGLHRLTGLNNQYAARYWLMESNFLMRKESFLQKQTGNMLEMGFDGYTSIGRKFVFPLARNFAYNGPEQAVSFSVTLSDVRWNSSPTYNFNIPSHYESMH